MKNNNNNLNNIPTFCSSSKRKLNPRRTSKMDYHRIKFNNVNNRTLSSSFLLSKFWSNELPSLSFLCKYPTISSNYHPNPNHRIFLVLLSLLLLLFSIMISDVNSQSLPLFSSSSSSSTTSCDVPQCFFGNGGDDNRLDRKTCQEIHQIYHCLRHTLSPKACRGNLEYHTLVVLIKKSTKSKCRNRDNNGNNSGNSGGSAPLLGPNNNNSTGWSQNIPQVKSGSTFSQHQQLLPTNRVNYHRAPPMSSPSIGENGPGKSGFDSSSSRFGGTKPAYLQYCLSAAYNYTINVTIMPNFFIKNPQISPPTPTKVEFINEADTTALDDDLGGVGGSEDEAGVPVKPRRKHRKERVRRDAIGAIGSSQMLLQQQPPSLIYKPLQPMTPSLTCIIFGDPHIRTFDSRYQTCNCIGARSLIEHPLFDVQITNTRLQEQFNATGVTKVTVLVRRFGPCAIGNELIYETDSLASILPSSTFTDGSTYNFNNLIFITSSSQNKVITVHLDHIGVRVYISQFSHTKFLNVVIKFRTANLKTVKQNLILDSISSMSLCKSGCHPRELINIEQELKNAGVDTAIIAENNNKQQSVASESAPPVNSGSSQDVHSDDDDEEDEGDDVDEVDNHEEDYDEEDELEDYEHIPGHDELPEQPFETGFLVPHRPDDCVNVRKRKDANLAELIDKQYRRQQRRLERKRKKEAASASASASAPSAPGSPASSSSSVDSNRNKKKKPKSPAHSSSEDQLLQQNRNAKRNLLRSAIFQQNNNQQNQQNSYSLQSIPYDILASLSSTNYRDEHVSLKNPNKKGSSLLASISAPPQSQPPPSIGDDHNHQHQQLLPILPQPTVHEECSEMIGYYRLTCLYDSVLKGIVSIDPHKFASSFDEPRFNGLEQSSQENNNNQSLSNDSGATPSHSSPKSSVPSVGCHLVLLTVFTTITYYYYYRP